MTNLPYEDQTKEILVKKESGTNPDYGCYPEDRPTDEMISYGIVNIDKPKGPTSHQVSDYVQRILGLKKAGHSGTLDPGVTGVLPIALGKATRIVQTLLPAGKEYVGIMHVHKDVSVEDIKGAFERFTGKIKQLPPIKSSVKRQWRDRKVYYLDLLEIDGQDVLFRVGCEAGTYIRKLMHDIGQDLGTGAHMAELRRTRVANFDESTIVKLQDLADAYYYYKEEKNDKLLREMIKPVEFAIQHLPKIWVNDNTVDSLCHGASLKVPGISKLNDGIENEQIVGVMSLKDELVCLAKAQMTSKQMLKEERGVAALSHKVFMEPGVYAQVKR